MGKRRNVADEIVDIRERLIFSYSHSELIFRRFALSNAFAKRDQVDIEFRRYFPVAIVACFEGFFRLAVKEFLDTGSPYLDRAEGFATQIRFDYEVIRSLQGKRITIGELIAHNLSWNNLAQINTHLSVLIDKDFLIELRTIYDRAAHELYGKPKLPILSDPDITFKYVTKVFELRHMICHEFASGVEILPEEIDACYSHSMLFLDASIELLNNVLHPNAPLTQSQISAEADRRRHEALAKLDELSRQLIDNLDSSRTNEYLKVNEAWQNYVELASRFVADGAKGGSMWSTLYNSVAECLALDRIEHVKNMISRQLTR